VPFVLLFEGFHGQLDRCAFLHRTLLVCVPLLGQQLGPAHIGGHAAAGVGARRCSAVASTGYVRAAARR
jgi:hypothetical protein